MPLIPDQDLEQVRARSDIVQVIGDKLPLKKSGRHFKACCPFHNEKTPSFMVNPDKQIYHCFGCGEGGDVFSFLMKYDGLEFVEAVERLAEQHGIVLTRTGGGTDQVRQSRAEKELLLRINRLAARFFHEMLLQNAQGQRGRDYLEGRGIRGEIVRESALGYAPADGKSLTHHLNEKKVPMEKARELGLVHRGDAGDYYDFFRNRLITSILTTEGKVLGFSGRALADDAQPKYLNSPESPVYHKSDSLLGVSIARPAIREKDEVVLVEGNFDLLRLHQEGIRNVVAPLGTALTEGQIRSLARWTQNFVLIFDGDEAGQKAADRALLLFLPLGIHPRTVLLPLGEDPDSFVKKEGVESLRGRISRGGLLLDMKIERLLKKTRSGPQVQKEAVAEIAGLLSLLPGEVERRLYIERAGKKFGLAEDLLQAEIFGEKGRAGRGRRETGYADKKISNFPGGSDDQGGRLPSLERTVLEVLLSEKVVPETLFREIDARDFSHPHGREVWTGLKDDYQKHGAIEIARILTALPEGPVKRLITELAMSSSRWEDEGSRVAADCLRQLRASRMKGLLKELSDEIRQAESEGDLRRMRELLNQKNRLIKEMTSLH